MTRVLVAGCEQLLLDRRDFVEYDVEADADALRRMLTLTGGGRAVPVLVEADKVQQVGWRGRACMVDGAPPTSEAG
jgi:hypothetical protein